MPARCGKHLTGVTRDGVSQMSNTDHTALRLFVNHPSWMEHGRQIVAINKVCPSRMFGGMWCAGLAGGGEVFLFGSEITVSL